MWFDAEGCSKLGKAPFGGSALVRGILAAGALDAGERLNPLNPLLDSLKTRFIPFAGVSLGSVGLAERRVGGTSIEGGVPASRGWTRSSVAIC